LAYNLHLFSTDGSGAKGLGLYIVPKIWVNEDGSLGEPNDVTCIDVEHKMGMKASATAVLNFGENDSCRGILVGNPTIFYPMFICRQI
jgi:alkylation response protein AidB-like acyl-CoA dehydrogenase